MLKINVVIDSNTPKGYRLLTNCPTEFIINIPMTKKKNKPQSNEKELILVALLLAFTFILLSQKNNLQANLYHLFGGTDSTSVYAAKKTAPPVQKLAPAKTTVRK